MTRTLAKIALFLIVAYLGLVIYTNRAIFFSRFDSVHWQDKFEHSQWRLPLSVRTIGDDGLFIWGGWSLIHGGDPTAFNAEMPPFGKYVLGLILVTIDNAQWFGFLTTLAAILFFYLLTRALFKQPVIAIILTLIFLTDPLVTSQLTNTMLDSIQLACALATLLLLTKIIASPRLKPAQLLILGLTFGLFTGSKTPLLTPILGLIVIVALLIKTKKLLPLVIFGATALITYASFYFRYFALGHTLHDWLAVQKWIISFYRQSNLAPNWGSVFPTLLANRYQNLFSHQWEVSSQWSLSWPIITLMAIWASLKLLPQKTSRLVWWVLIAFSVLLLGFYAAIPFWTRYLLLLTPFLYILSGYLLTTLKPKIIYLILGVLLICNLGASSAILFPTPESTVGEFLYEWHYGFFQDMYEEITVAAKKPLTRDQFQRFGLSTYADAQIESIAIDLMSSHWSTWKSQQEVKLHITYFTRNLGPFTQDEVLPVIKENGAWRIPWQWDDLIAGLNLQTKLNTTVDFAKRGAVIASDNKKLIEDINSYMVWVTPGQINYSREDEMLKTLEGLFQGKTAAIALHQRLHGNTLSDQPIALGVLPFVVDDKLKTKLLGYSGLSLTPQFARVYRPNNLVTLGYITNSDFIECCSELYTTTTYNGSSGLEKQYNSLLKGLNGGNLKLIDQDGQVLRTILSPAKRDGQDVHL